MKKARPAAADENTEVAEIFTELLDSHFSANNMTGIGQSFEGPNTTHQWPEIEDTIAENSQENTVESEVRGKMAEILTETVENMAISEDISAEARVKNKSDEGGQQLGKITFVVF